MSDHGVAEPHSEPFSTSQTRCLAGCLDGTRRLLGLWMEGRSFVHAVKNPLAGVMGAAQVMRDELEESDPSRCLMEEILCHLHKLDELVDEYGRTIRSIPPPNSQLSIDEAASRTAEELRGQLGLQVDKRLEAGGTLCRGSELLIYLAMWDIMRGRNARAFILRTARNEVESSVDLTFALQGEEGKAEKEPCSQAPSSPFERALEEALGRDGAKVIFYGPSGRRIGFTATFPVAEMKKQ